MKGKEWLICQRLTNYPSIYTYIYISTCGHHFPQGEQEGTEDQR